MTFQERPSRPHQSQERLEKRLRESNDTWSQDLQKSEPMSGAPHCDSNVRVSEEKVGGSQKDNDAGLWRKQTGWDMEIDSDL